MLSVSDSMQVSEAFFKQVWGGGILGWSSGFTRTIILLMEWKINPEDMLSVNYNMEDSEAFLKADEAFSAKLDL
jgi:hypothetical protein